MTQQTVPVSQIVVGENPRTFFDSEDQEQLERSIKLFGLLAPITVEQTDAEEFKLIAGERRLRAFQNLGIEEIPAHVTTVADHAGAAIAENVTRVNLHPIEEGRAYVALLTNAKGKAVKPATLAKNLGIPAKRIVDRVRLALLPAELADAMISGARIDKIRDELTDFTEKFGGELVSRFVEASLEPLTELVVDGDENIHTVFSSWLDLQDPKPAIEFTWRAWQNLPTDVAEELLVLAKNKTRSQYEQNEVLELNSEADEAAARSYGCLVEFEDADEFGQAIQYCTDIAWMADRIRYNIGQLEAIEPKGEVVETPKRRIDPETGEVKAPTAEELEAEAAAAKKVKREEAAAAKAEREERGRVNQAFGINLQKKLSKRKLTHADAKLLAEMVLIDENSIGLCWEAVRDEKVDGPDRYQKAKSLRAWVSRGKNADEVIGRLFQVVLVTVFHDRGAFVKSRMVEGGFQHTSRYGHLLDLLASVGPDELVEPYMAERKTREERQAMYDAADAAALEYAQEQNPVNQLTDQNTDGETTGSAGETGFPVDTGIDAEVAAERLEIERDNVEPDPTTEPSVSPEEADEPLLSEQVAAAQLPDAGEESQLTQDEQIEKLAQQSRDALQAELDRESAPTAADVAKDDFDRQMEEIS
jgi:ParB/RepB/Spo0J family partition protein